MKLNMHFECKYIFLIKDCPVCVTHSSLCITPRMDGILLKDGRHGLLTECNIVHVIYKK